MQVTKPKGPKACEFEALKVGLTQFNESFTGPVLREKVASFVKSDSGEILGGVLGEINWNWMHIQGLWLDEKHRKGGWGSRLMSEMEHYALAKTIHNIRLETTTFQALDFYTKRGYTIFGELKDMPNGHTSYFLQKRLGLESA